MNSPTSEEAPEKTPVATGVDSEGKSAQTAHSKVGIDAERIQSSIVRLTSNSTGELEKLVAELGRLQEFLKSETERVQREIETVMDGTGIIIEALGPWKKAALSTAQNTLTNVTPTNGAKNSV